MATEAPTPLPLRPSSADRERVLRVLRDRSAEGRLSVDTFAQRVEEALAARSGEELEELVADVRPPSRLRRAALRAVVWLSGLIADIEDAWNARRVPGIALPALDGEPVAIGRSRECQCVVAEPSVSRRHARLRREGERWFLRDLGSRNGTRVNGVHVTEETEVRPGDRLSLGGVALRLGRPAA
jgi:FHA domain/Domain of unknown function (DUF1707)